MSERAGTMTKTARGLHDARTSLRWHECWHDYAELADPSRQSELLKKTIRTAAALSLCSPSYRSYILIFLVVILGASGRSSTSPPSLMYSPTTVEW